MNKVNMTTLVLASLVTLSVVPPAYAFNFGLGAKANVELRQDIKKDMREDAKDASKPGILSRFFNRGNRVTVINGKLTAKNSTTLTVEKDGTSYTVNTDSNTQFRRKFWGKSSLDELAVGNMVNVIGHWTDDAHTAVLANQVRNLSIQKRFGIFFGVVKSISANGWVMSTISQKRTDQTVTVSSSTKFTNRKEETIAQSDVSVGARVRVRGLWDSSANTVTEVTAVKDFSLPIKAAVTVTPTVSPTATP